MNLGGSCHPEGLDELNLSLSFFKAFFKASKAVYQSQPIPLHVKFPRPLFIPVLEIPDKQCFPLLQPIPHRWDIGVYATITISNAVFVFIWLVSNSFSEYYPEGLLSRVVPGITALIWVPSKAEPEVGLKFK